MSEMNERDHMTIQRERAPGLALLKEAFDNVIGSSPEVLNRFADLLESELNTMDTSERQQIVQNAIDAIRAAANSLEVQ